MGWTAIKTQQVAVCASQRAWLRGKGGGTGTSTGSSLETSQTPTLFLRHGADLGGNKTCVCDLPRRFSTRPSWRSRCRCLSATGCQSRAGSGALLTLQGGQGCHGWGACDLAARGSRLGRCDLTRLVRFVSGVPVHVQTPPAPAPIADTCIFDDRTASFSGRAGLGVGATTTAENGTKTAAGKWGWCARVASESRGRGQSNSPTATRLCTHTQYIRCESKSGGWRFALWVVCMESWSLESGHSSCGNRWPGASQGQMRCVVDGRDSSVSVQVFRAAMARGKCRVADTGVAQCSAASRVDRAGPQGLSSAVRRAHFRGTDQRGGMTSGEELTVQSWASHWPRDGCSPRSSTSRLLH